jgi:hypothetical protein
MLSPNLTSWCVQYQRLQRSFIKLSQPYASSVAYDDDLHHFFQDCFHLKDWIKNDLASGVAARIEQEVNAERPLRIVADLANAAKHLVRHTSREGAYVTSSNVTVHLGQDKPIAIEYIVSLGDGSILFANQVAEDAMTSWAAIFARLGLHT